MRNIMFLLLVIGVFTLVIGINAWVNSVSNTEVVSVFMGLIFGISITILGGAILLIDAIILTFYLLRKKRAKTLAKV